MADEKKSPAEIKAEAERKAYNQKNAKFLAETNKKAAEQNEILLNIQAQLGNDSKKSVGALKKLLDSQTTKLGKDRFTDAQKKQITDQFGLQQLGFSQTDAAARVGANTELQELQQQKERLENLQKEFGVNAVDQTELNALNADIQSLEEIKKFGRTLTTFEKGFQTFAGGKFEDLINSTKNQGALTAQGIAKSFGDDLKGDFDKALSLFGPVVGLLQQIPLLGTILNLAKSGLKRLFVELFLSRKGSKVQSKKLIRSQKETTGQLVKELKFQRREARRERRRRAKERLAGAKGGRGGKTVNQRTPLNPLLVYFVSQLMKVLGSTLPLIGAGLAAVGKGIGAGITAFFAGISAGLATFANPLVLKGAAIFGAAIAIIGATAAGAIWMVLRSIKSGFKGWKEEGLPELFEQLSSDRIKPGKITALIAGLGLSSVLSAIGGLATTIATFGGTFTPFTDLGKDLGGFAKHQEGFDKLDGAAIAKNLGILSGMSIVGGVGGFLSSLFNLGGALTPFADLGKDLGGFATSVKPFMNMDMPKFKSQIKMLSEALGQIHFPSFSSFLQGQSLLHQIRKLTDIQMSQPDLGDQMQAMGIGVSMISSGIETLTVEKAKVLGRLGKEIGQGFDNFNLNFGMIPQSAGAGQNLYVPYGGVGGQQQNQPMFVNHDNSTNITHEAGRGYSAAGVSLDHIEKLEKEILG